MITLYDFRHGARGLRTAWLCEEMGQPHAFVPVDYPPGPDYLALNPSGTVPYLADGTVALTESVAMMLYITQAYGPTPLLPLDDLSLCARVLQFTLFGEASLAAPMGPLLAARFGAPDEHKRTWTVEQIERGLRSKIAQLEGQLEGQDFLAGSNLTLADISVVTALKIWTGGLAQKLPAMIADYCARLQDRPAFKRAAAQHA